MDTDRIKAALNEALSLIGEIMSYDNWKAYRPYLQERVEEFIAPYDAHGIDHTLGLSAPSPVGQEAREAAVRLVNDFFTSKGVTLTMGAPTEASFNNLLQKTLADNIASALDAAVAGERERIINMANDYITDPIEWSHLVHAIKEAKR